MKKSRFFILSFFIFYTISITAQAYPLTPNLQTTPGSLCSSENPDYVGQRYGAQIAYCQRNVDSNLKTQLYLLYGVPLECKGQYTIDHFIPLSIGGDNSPQNLWPEHKFVKATRPHLEQEVYEDLRDGRITQQEAIDKVYHVKTQAQNLLFYAGTNNPCDQ